MSRSHSRNTPLTDTAPDRDALSELGAQVCERLDADPSVYRVPVENIDIFVAQDFLTPAECLRFIDLVDATAVPSSVFDKDKMSRFRTSYSGDVDREDPFVGMIERRIDDLLGIDPSFGETVQGQRYRPGQEYQGHCDWFPPLSEMFRAEIAMGGQRSFTAMIYLNDVEEGGITDFPHVGVSVTPRQGMLLAWNNARADGTPNTYTMHAAKPVERGVKYVITKWYRSRRWGY